MLKQELEGCELHKERKDKWIWKEDQSQAYKLRLAYTKLQDNVVGEDEDMYNKY